ncbi:hypothetical protein Micbo1qcDRAFT_209753 [Microdochium bolleyi]|uniref:Uncharacterized protein n=1 Tax=Microdochium bolleyi TaxID=196109 RepID=A0A136IL52_9PEZI|nr:hypothetical protein Micbo1qcDRAFT_209753 [Microdochium bolleyi]
MPPITRAMRSRRVIDEEEDNSRVIPLLKLPLNVRNKIYDFYTQNFVHEEALPLKILLGNRNLNTQNNEPFSPSGPHVPDSEFRKIRLPPLAVACQQVYAETLPIMRHTVAVHMDDWVLTAPGQNRLVDIAGVEMRAAVFPHVPVGHANHGAVIKRVQLIWHLVHVRQTESPERRCDPMLVLRRLQLGALETLQIVLQTEPDGSWVPRPEHHDECLRLAQPGLMELIEGVAASCPALRVLEFVGVFEHSWLNEVHERVAAPRGIRVWGGDQMWSEEWTTRRRPENACVWELCEHGRS